MNHARDIDPLFASWLAGFIDGEGCFQIQKGSGRGYFCNLCVSLRDDDRPVLELICATTGLGKVRQTYGERGVRGGVATWQVHRKAECVELVELFDRFPLRAKKARDYVLWREAVLEWTGMQMTGSDFARNDWTRTAELKGLLQAGRKYQFSASSPKT